MLLIEPRAREYDGQSSKHRIMRKRSIKEPMERGDTQQRPKICHVGRVEGRQTPIQGSSLGLQIPFILQGLAEPLCPP